jgi:16S rRNA G1207 methylase RsmC
MTESGERAAIARLPREIEFTSELRGQRLTFASTWGLFSPKAVDEGTRLLLDRVEVNPGDRCLDLGCGYGAIGLTLARLAPQGTTVFVDKDTVAVEYANRNVEANGLANCEVVTSNGFDALDGRTFDLVASNLPAKVGNELLTILIADARAHLARGGRLYVVTLSGMRRFIERTMRGVFGNYEKVKQGRQHTVALAVR